MIEETMEGIKTGVTKICKKLINISHKTHMSGKTIYNQKCKFWYWLNLKNQIMHASDAKGNTIQCGNH